MVARVRVVGSSGAGKTTFARTLARRLGLPHLELDSVHHQPGWSQASDDGWTATIEDFLDRAPGGWVVDGNYSSRPQDRLRREADTVVWLDPPRLVALGRAARRTARRVITREELWNGNRETARNLVRRDPTENILLWVWTAHPVVRRRNLPEWERHRDGAHGVRWVRLRTLRDAREWIDSVDGNP